MKIRLCTIKLGLYRVRDIILQKAEMYMWNEVEISHNFMQFILQHLTKMRLLK